MWMGHRTDGQQLSRFQTTQQIHANMMQMNVMRMQIRRVQTVNKQRRSDYARCVRLHTCIKYDPPPLRGPLACAHCSVLLPLLLPFLLLSLWRPGALPGTPVDSDVILTY